MHDFTRSVADNVLPGAFAVLLAAAVWLQISLGLALRRFRRSFTDVERS